MPLLSHLGSNSTTDQLLDPSGINAALLQNHTASCTVAPYAVQSTPAVPLLYLLTQPSSMALCLLFSLLSVTASCM